MATKLNKTDFQFLFRRGTAANLPDYSNYYAAEGEPLFTTDGHDLYISTGSANQFIGGASNAWTTDSNVVNLVVDTDTVTIGSNTAGGKLFIDGDADEIQLQVQGNATQTANLTEWQNSSGTVLSSVSKNGAGFFSTPTATENVLTLQTTDDSSTNPLLSLKDSLGQGLVEFVAPGSFNYYNSAGTLIQRIGRSGGHGYFQVADGSGNIRNVLYANGDSFIYYKLGLGFTNPQPGVSQASAQLHARSANATWITGIFQGAASQTANLTEWQNSSGTVLGGRDKDGVIIMGEVTTPTAVTNYGKIYPKTDDRLYWQDGAGVEHTVQGHPIYKSYNVSTQGLGANPDVYAAGFLEYSASDANLTNASTTVTIGSANTAYAAHAFIVAGGAGTTDGSDLVLTVTGTSINDDGTRNGSDSEVIVADATAMALDGHVETAKKWLGQVTFTLSSTGGTTFSFDFNYGLSKYEDFNNEDFTLTGVEAVGFAGANDSNFDIKVMHYNSTWTYHATTFDPIVAGNTLASLATDHAGDKQLSSSENFAWKRANLSQTIAGSGSEGIIIRVESSANNAVEYCNIHLAVTF